MCLPPIRFVSLLLFLWIGGVAWGDVTSFTIESASDDPLLHGYKGSFTPQTGLVVLQPKTSEGGALRLDCYYQGIGPLAPYISLIFHAPADGPLHAGVYDDTRYPRIGAAIDHPALEVFHSSTGRGLRPARGRFEVIKATYGNDNELIAFHATFSLQAEGAPSGLSGEIKLHADLTTLTVNQPPGLNTGGPLRTLPLTPVALPAAAADDQQPAGSALSFRWSDYESQGIVLDDPTKLQALATFPQVGGFHLTLEVSDGQFTTRRVLDVQVLEPGAETFIHLRSQPGEPIFRGNSRLLKRFEDAITCSVLGGELNIEAVAADGSQRFRVANVPLSGPGVYTVEAQPPVGGAEASIDRENVRHDLRGTINLRHIVRDGSGRVSQLWMLLNLSPRASPAFGPPTPPLLIEIRYEMPEGTIGDQPPLVEAGEDRALTRRERTFLRGNVLDDRAGEPVANWSKASGPGDVEFSDPASPVTEATFTEYGTYVLRLTSDDGTHQVSDEVTVEWSALESSVFVRGLPLKAGTVSFAHAYIPQDAAWVVTQNAPGEVTLDLVAEESLFAVKFSSFASDYIGEPMHVGTYRTSPTSGRGNGSVRLVGPEFGDAYLNSFVVHEVAYDEEGKLATLHADVVGDDATGSYGFFTTIRFNAASPSSSGPNHAPRLRMSAPYFTSGKTFTLDASVSEDELPNGQPIQVVWEQVSGPGAATFDDPHVINPIVQVPVPGVYRLRVTVSDGDLTSSAEKTVVVKNGARTYGGIVQVGGAIGATVAMTVQPNGRSTARLTFYKSSVVLRGQFVDGYWSGGFTNTQGQSVWYVFRGNADDTAIRATIAIGNTYYEITAVQNQAFGPVALSEAPSREGTYNLLLFPTSTSAPAGTGFARLTVAKAGAARAVVRLPDGSAGTCGGRMSVGDEMPLLTRLRGGKGLLAGYVHFPQETESDPFTVTGAMSWYHTEQPRAPRFSSFFYSAVKVGGLPYTPPMRGSNSFSQQPAVCAAVLAAARPLDPFGNPDPAFNVALRFNADATVVPVETSPDFRLKINRAAGTFQGSFVSDMGEPCSFAGLLNPQIPSGDGYFLSPTGGGRVRIDLPPEPASAGAEAAATTPAAR